MSRSRPQIDVHPRTFLAADLTSTKYDVVVIGAGPAGMTAAVHTATQGLSTLVIEAELAGGECINWACVPSKALLRAAEAVEGARAVGGARELVRLVAAKHGGSADPTVDARGTFARRDMFTNNWIDNGPIAQMRATGIHFAHGLARLTSVKVVQLRDWHSGSETAVEATHAVIVATGSIPKLPDVEGLAQSRYWTPREAVSADEVPESLIILGAGAVGSEMATLYNQLGSRVTLLCRTTLPKLVPEARSIVMKSLIKAGVNIKSNSEIHKVEESVGEVVVSLSDGSIVRATHLLVATGRQPQTASLGLTTIGLPVDTHWLEVDDSMCVSSVSGKWLWAVGDVNGRALLTHVGKYQGKVAANAIVAMARSSFDDEVARSRWNKLVVKPKGLAIAQCVFTDPQIASAGLTSDDAAAKGIKARTVEAPLSGPGLALHADGYNGWAQWVVDEAGTLIGATFVGRDVANLIHASTMAIVGRMTLEQIWHVTPAFPTMSEIYTTLSEAA